MRVDCTWSFGVSNVIVRGRWMDDVDVNVDILLSMLRCFFPRAPTAAIECFGDCNSDSFLPSNLSDQALCVRNVTTIATYDTREYVTISSWKRDVVKHNVLDRVFLVCCRLDLVLFGVHGGDLVLIGRYGDTGSDLDGDERGVLFGDDLTDPS